MPERYSEIIRLAREAIALYREFLEEIDERQRFTEEGQA
jgi:hypothetical protein